MMEWNMKFKTELGVTGGTGQQVMCNVQRHHSNVDISINDPCDPSVSLMVSVNKDDYRAGIESLRGLYQNRLSSMLEEINKAMGLCEVDHE